MMAKRAQGTIEYLVIIAIVVVIALVVVGLLLQVMNQGSGVPETTAKTAWKSAEPWAIVDWTMKDVGTDCNLTLILKNNSYEAMDLNAVRLGDRNWGLTGNDGTINGVPAGSATTSDQVVIPNVVCTGGQKYSISKSTIYIDYNSATIAGKVQAGTADIVGTAQ
ncbi:MAG: class III signal peptide-containing protein [archaeon]